MWISWLFLLVVVSLPVALTLAVLARVFARRGRPGRAATLRRAMEIALLTGGLALVPLLIERASTRPSAWVVAVLLLAVLIFGAVGMVRDARARKAAR